MVRKDKTKTVLILIIEDEAEVRNFASRVLELEGYRVLRAEDGDEGLRLVREERRIALVLLDLKLPGDDGWMVLKQLKKEPELSSIPVIVFTASVAEPQRMRASAMGADYLAKPLSAASLRKSVARILRRKGTR